MARKLRYSDLETKAARRRLAPRGKPYWAPIERGQVHLGYRRLSKDQSGKFPSGTWVVRQYLGDQKYRVESLGSADDWNDANGNTILSYSQAYEKARAKIEYRTENDAGNGEGPYTVREAIDSYLAHLGDRKSDRAERDARYKAEAFILPAFAEREVASLVTEEIRNWLYKTAEAAPRKRTAKMGKRAKAQQFREFNKGDENAKRKRRATANRVLTIFRAALNHAFKDGKVKSDAAWRRVQPFPNVEVARKDFLDERQAKRLLSASEKGFRRLAEAALLTGCRFGELATMRVGDFHYESGTITFQRSKTGPRTVILNDVGVAYFDNLSAGREPSEHMLLKSNGTAWNTSQQIRPMRDACKAARMKPVGFHALRHSWASIAVMNNLPLLVVAGNLGHSDTRMVEKHYGHLSHSYQKQQIRKAAPSFGIKAPSNVVPISRKR